MFTELACRNFKCFSNLKLTLAPLTLLTGFNGGGKSSSIQPLSTLLLNRARGGRIADGLSLNGSFVRLGNSGDVVSSDGNPVFTIARDQNAVTWHLTPKIGFRSLVVSWAEISNRQGANRSVGRNTFSRANGEGRPYRIV